MGDKARFTSHWEQIILRVGMHEEKIRVACESKAHARRMTLIFYKVRKGLTDPEMKTFADRIVTHVDDKVCEFVPDEQTWYGQALNAALTPTTTKGSGADSGDGETVPHQPATLDQLQHDLGD